MRTLDCPEQNNSVPSSTSVSVRVLVPSESSMVAGSSEGGTLPISMNHAPLSSAVAERVTLRLGDPARASDMLTLADGAASPQSVAFFAGKVMDEARIVGSVSFVGGGADISPETDEDMPPITDASTYRQQASARAPTALNMLYVRPRVYKIRNCRWLIARS